MTSIARYERFDNDGIELIIDTLTGESFASISGYARMSGQSVDAIAKRVKRGSKGLDKSIVKTVEVQTPGGLQGVYLINEDTISDWIIDDNPKLAKAMLKAGVRVFLHTSAGYTVKSSNGEPYWYARLKQFRQDNPVPEGYFSIFEETINLVAEFEALDCIIPDNAIPDISIGKHWATYLRTERNIEPNEICTTYPHTYPGKYDKRGTRPANAYPEDMLPMFRQWFRATYRPTKLPAYIKRQHKGLLPVLGQLLGLSMAELKQLK